MNIYEAVIGIDVAKDTIAVTILCGDTEAGFTSKNSGKAFVKSLPKFAKRLDRSKVLVVMENTGNYHLELATFLHERGYVVSVVNPYVIKKYAEMKMKRTKTDSVDSKLIAEFGRLNTEIRTFKPKSKIQYEMEIKLKTIEDFQMQVNIHSNQLSALERQPFCSEELKMPYRKLINDLNEAIAKIEKELKEIMETYFPEELQLLSTIPGVGKRLSCIIVSMLKCFDGFEKGKQVTSYLGICPSPYESGTSVKRSGRIMKKGNPYIRKILFLCALSASRFNKACRELYERLIQNGKEKRVALVAVANKLIRQAFAVIKHKTPYREDYLLQKGA